MLRESSIVAGTDAVEHSSIAKNWTTDMQQSFPYQHKNVLEDAMDTIFKLRPGSDADLFMSRT